MATETVNSGQELIDATQNAIMQAADKVSEMIEPVAAEAAGHGHGAFYENPEFWVGMAFIFVVFALFRPVSKALGALMRKRIDNIVSRIDEAAALKDDAQKLLADYEAKFQNAKKEASEILKKSQKRVDLIKKENLEKLENEMNLRRKEAESRISSAKDEAEKEIMDMASKLTVAVVKSVLQDNLDEAAQDKLIDEAIDKIA